MYFINERHEHTFNQFVEKAQKGIYKPNQNTLKLLYILSALERTSQNIDKFFVFEGNYPNFDGICNVSLSRGEQYLVALAFNLYNGYRVEGMDLSPYTLMNCLDKELQRVLGSALVA